MSARIDLPVLAFVVLALLSLAFPLVGGEQPLGWLQTGTLIPLGIALAVAAWCLWQHPNGLVQRRFG